jgi:DNA-binding response OmpR family regulator
MARILVIDDDSDIATLVGLKLELDGHDVAMEADGLKGLARAQTDRPDVMIVDWTLPGLSGPEICAHIRADTALDSTWVIMLTARPLGVDGLQQTGADELVTKPFSPRNLSERVAAALDR